MGLQVVTMFVAVCYAAIHDLEIMRILISTLSITQYPCMRDVDVANHLTAVPNNQKDREEQNDYWNKSIKVHFE